MARTNRPPGQPPDDDAPTSKTPGVYRDKHGQWWATIGSGKSRVAVRCPQSENTEAKARQLRKELARKRDDKIDIKAGKQTCTQFGTTWLKKLSGPKLRDNSVVFYQQMLETHILPVIGTMQLEDVGADDVDRILDACRRDYAPRTVRHAYDVGKRLFKAAVRRRYLAWNPFDAVDPPMVDEAERPTLTLAQCRTLLGGVTEHRLYALYALVLVYGLRLGELLGLRVADLDFAQRQITIVQQATHVAGKLEITPPKTKRSARTLPLVPAIEPLLRERLVLLEAERTRGKWREHGLLFPSRVGTPLTSRNFNTHYIRVRRECGLPAKVTFHDLRHTANSRLAAAGASQVISAWVLGHSLPGMTGHYTHADVEAMRPWVAASAAVLLEGTVVIDFKTGEKVG